MANEPDRLSIGQEREPTDRSGHEGGETLVVGRKRPRGVIPGDAVLPSRHRVRLIAAEDHPTVLALAVDEVVRVAETRHVSWQLGTGHRPQGDVLMVDRRRRDGSPDQGRHLRRPESRSIHDDVRVDRTVVGEDPTHLAPCRQLEPRHADTGADPDAERAGRVSHRVRRGMRIEVPVAGEVDRAVQCLGGDGGHQEVRLPRADHLDLEADPAGAAGGPLELAKLIRAGREAKASDSVEDAESLVQSDAVPPERHHRRRGVERRDQPGRVAGRARRQRRLLHEQDIGPAGLGEMERDAAAGDPTADDDDPGGIDSHGGQRYDHDDPLARRTAHGPIRSATIAP